MELLLSLALVGLILSGVFGVAQGAMQLGKSMHSARVAETRISNFVTAWRDYFENVPPGIVLASGAEKAAYGSSGNLFILGSQMPFVWDQRLKTADAVEFGLVRERGTKNISLVVRHLKRPAEAANKDTFESIAELPILEGLKQMQWQFYDAQDQKWFTTWDPKKRNAPPLYLKLKFSFHADPREHEYTFWLGSSQAPLMGNQPAAPRQQ